MEYLVRKANNQDLDIILRIYAHAREFMVVTGNPTQWGSAYPEISMLEEDIRQESLYVVENKTGIHGVFAFYLGEDATYQRIDNGSWRSSKPYGTIHRIAGDGSGGIFTAALAYCSGVIDYLRIDTHADNKVMQHTVTKAGFQYCGIIYTYDGTSRLAYDRF